MRNRSWLLVLVLWCASAAGEPAANKALEDEVFATVDDVVITRDDFAFALQEGVKRKFYHGKVPEGELAAFQREIGERLIERTLLLREARRRGLEPDPQWVAARLERYEQRFARHPQWPEHRDRVLAELRETLGERSVVEQLTRQTRQVPDPSAAQLRKFYQANPDKFTEPERFRVSAILLKVDPSASTAVWEAATAEAEELVRKLRAGADFAELARLHSGDSSAAQGGDMGYLHRGMLGEPAQVAVDALAEGAITEPVTLLEGVGIFRLEDRPPRRLRTFEEVAERARGLWLREQQEAAWQALLAQLRAAAVISVNESHYLPL